MTVDNDAERLASIREYYSTISEAGADGAFLLRALDSRDAALREAREQRDAETEVRKKADQQRDDAIVAYQRVDRELREAREEVGRLQAVLSNAADVWERALEEARSQPATPSPVPIQQQDIGSSVMTDISGREQPSPETRCLITGNECGTDTWQIGRPCKCENCQAYIATMARACVVTGNNLCKIPYCRNGDCYLRDFSIRPAARPIRQEATALIIAAARTVMDELMEHGEVSAEAQDDLLVGLQRYNSTPDEGGWLPIETAPKELDERARGPLVDLWIINRRLTDCFWADESWCQLERYGQGPSIVKGSPSYWRPRPAPPSQEPS